jgi:bifunctional non-homologous end joining protein LigD
VAVYSLRAREHPTVSTPVSWTEVERALKKKDASLLVFEAPQVVKRVEEMGDLFGQVLQLKQRLPDRKSLAEPAAEAQEPVSLAAQAEDEPAPVRRRAGKKSASKAAKRPSARKTSRKV